MRELLMKLWGVLAFEKLAENMLKQQAMQVLCLSVIWLVSACVILGLICLVMRVLDWLGISKTSMDTLFCWLLVMAEFGVWVLYLFCVLVLTRNPIAVLAAVATSLAIVAFIYAACVV